MIDAGRRKLAERVSPDPTMVELTEIDGQVVMEPVADRVEPAPNGRRLRKK